MTYNTYANLVSQKVNYLLANPIEPQTDEKEFEKVAAILDTAFDKRIRAIGVDIRIAVSAVAGIRSRRRIEV